MLERLFGWSKASKCKSLVRTVINRVKLLRNKRSIKIKQARADIAQLLGNGQHQNCFKRVDFLFQEQNLLDGYDMVVKFCECILERLSYIRRHKDRPEDINEAVSSLIYASARCADLPELLRLRSLFAKRYGYEFASSAVNLRHDSCVNKQIIEKLSDRLPALDFKLKLVKGIAVELNLQWDSSNIEAEFGDPTKDLMGGSGGSEKFNTENSKSCQNGVDSSFHPSVGTRVDNTSIQSVNDESSNINEFSDSIKKQRRAYCNESNEKSALYVGCEDQIFERDISVVSGSVEETFVETSSLEKTKRLPDGIGLISSYHNVGPRSNGCGFVKGSSFDSCSIDNHHFEDLGYNNGSAAEPAGGATSWATNLSKVSNSSTEVKHSGSLIDYTAENREDVSNKKMLHQSDTMPLQSRHSRWVHTAENGHRRTQTCSPERRGVPVDKDSELRSARHTSPCKSQKTKLMQTSSDCYGEKQEIHNYSKRHVNTRRLSPRCNTNVNKVGDSSIEFDGHRWCSPKHEDAKRDIERLVIVDDTVVSEIYPEGWTMQDNGCYFQDYIDVDLRSRLEDRLQRQNSSGTRKKIRQEARRRHSISSHHPIEINNLYPHNNNSADNTFPVLNRSGHLKTASSKNENREGVLCSDDFVKTEGSGTVRKYSDRGTNIRVMAQPRFEDTVTSISSNGHRTSYDMIDSYIDTDSDVEIPIIPQNIYQARDRTSPGHIQLHGKKTIQRGKMENKHHSFEEHDIRKVYDKDKSNIGRQRSNENPNGFQLSKNDEMLNGTCSSRKQIFYPSKEIHIARFMRDRSCGLHQNVNEATLHSPDDSGENMLYANDTTFTSSSVDMHPYELQKHGDDSTLHSLDVSQSPKNNDHHENNDMNVEQNFHQSINTRQWSSPTLMRDSKTQEIHCKGGKTLENKPQKGRQKSPNLCEKDHYDCDIDSSDSEDQYARQSHRARMVQKPAHMTNSESVRRSLDHKFHENKSSGGSSILLEENYEEPEFGGNMYDKSTARRIGNLCSPRVSFVYIDRPGKAQQQLISMPYIGKNDSNQACIERQRVHRIDSLPPKERQQCNKANTKNMNSTCDLARDELKNSLYEACNRSKSRNPPGTDDQVESHNQHMFEKSSMGEIPASFMHQNASFAKKNSDAASVGTPHRPPLSPATPSLSSGFRSCGRPSSPASPSTRPPQRPPPKLPCRWERAISLPPERSNASPVKSAVRSQSLQTNLSKGATSHTDSPRVLHVHPKLPEYDDLAAKFMAMKEHHRASAASE